MTPVALGIKPVEQQSGPMDWYKNALSMSAMMQQMKARDLDMQKDQFALGQAQQAASRQDQFRKALQAGTSDVDLAKQFPDFAQKYFQEQYTQQKAKHDAQKQQYENFIQGAEIQARVLDEIKTPGTAIGAFGKLIDAGILKPGTPEYQKAAMMAADVAQKGQITPELQEYIENAKRGTQYAKDQAALKLQAVDEEAKRFKLEHDKRMGPLQEEEAKNKIDAGALHEVTLEDGTKVKVTGEQLLRAQREGVEMKKYNNLLAAHAQRLNKDVADLTPTEKDDAVVNEKMRLAAAGRPVINNYGPLNTAGVTPDMKPEEKLAKLTEAWKPEDKILANGLLNYRITVGSRGGLPSATLEKNKPLIAAVMAADPTWSLPEYAKRQKVMEDFASGATSKNVTALNTVMRHLDTLKTGFDALNNNDVQAANKVVNWFREQTGDPRVSSLDVAALAVAHEAERAFRGNLTAESGIKGWLAKYGSGISRGQSDAALKTLAELLSGRVEETGTQWDSAFEGKKERPYALKHTGELLQKFNSRFTQQGGGDGWKIVSVEKVP